MTKANEIAKLRADLADARSKIQKHIEVENEMGARILALQEEVNSLKAMNQALAYDLIAELEDRGLTP